MISYLKRLFFGIPSQPRFAKCTILQARITGLHSLADQTSPDRFARELGVLQHRIEEKILSVNGVFHTYDIGEYVIGLPSDKNNNYIANILSLPDAFEQAVSQFLNALHLKHPSVRCIFGFSHGEAFFASDNNRATVSGQAVNEAGYALAAADSLGINSAFDSELSRLLAHRFSFRERSIFLSSIGKERKIYEPY